ncbi:MAG: hypothetical protein KA735_12550 [Burkholderiaceae bacterium]|nr:hypothetical protein [Burkholderiaceae bacterium]
MNNNERMILATRLPDAASPQEQQDFQNGLVLMASFLRSPPDLDKDFTFLPNPLLASWPQE